LRKQVRAIHFFTAGFSETEEEEMVALEREVVAKLKVQKSRRPAPTT